MYAVACPEADVELLCTLIRHGATIDQTSVSYALSDLQKLTELIDGGANISYHKEHGYDALINAAYGDDVLNHPQLLDIVNLLIANGVSLTGMTSYSESCVRVLSRIGRFDAVRLLLRAGANPEDVRPPAAHSHILITRVHHQIRIRLRQGTRTPLGDLCVQLLSQRRYLALRHFQPA